MTEGNRARWFAAFLSEVDRHPRPRRHPAEVTADRLADHMDRWPARFDGKTRDEVGHLRHVLERIAEGEEE